MTMLKISGITTVLILMTMTSQFTLAADAAAGQQKTAVCAGCHGPDGISALETNPNLKGQKAAYLIAQLQAFRDGTRVEATMNAMAKPLSDADIENIAAYYSGL